MHAVRNPWIDECAYLPVHADGGKQWYTADMAVCNAQVLAVLAAHTGSLSFMANKISASNRRTAYTGQATICASQQVPVLESWYD